jgi:hypothetical protein
LLKILDKDTNKTPTKVLVITEAKTSDSTVSTQPSSQKQDTASQKVTDDDRFAFLFKVKLNVTINAPIIYVPESSSSLNSLLLDCGLVRIGTSLEIQKNYFAKLDPASLNEKTLSYRIQLAPVIEIQKVNLSNMLISR